MTNVSGARVGDGVLLGGLAFAVGLIGLTVLMLGGWRTATGIAATAGAASITGAPMLALVNLFFVLRDKGRGKSNQALLGALLTGGTLLVCAIPWIGVD